MKVTLLFYLQINLTFMIKNKRFNFNKSLKINYSGPYKQKDLLVRNRNR